MSILFAPGGCNHFLRKIFLAALIGCLPVHSGGATERGAFNPTFPRLAAGQIGGWGAYDENRVRLIAKHDIAVLGTWRGWNAGGHDLATITDHIKSLNPDILLLNYTVPVEVWHSERETEFLRGKINREKGLNGNGTWWLLKADGSHVSSWHSTWRVNHSSQVTRDANGLIWPEWLARYHWAAPVDRGDWVRPSGRGMREGQWDGVYQDVQYVNYPTGGNAPAQPADWRSVGTDNDPLDPLTQQWVTEGHIAYINEWRRLEPSFLMTANLSNQIFGWQNNREQPAALNQANHGGWLEWWGNAETWGGWDMLMNLYRKTVEIVAPPKLAMMDVHLDYIRTHYGFGTDERWNRYFLASVLMDDGYYMISADDRYSRVLWFDEFDIQLGYPVDPPQTQSGSNGILRREFEHGLVLVNPKGNGRQTVSVGPGWRRFQGEQDPAHNNGQPASEITLDAQDGIILVREGSSAARPEAPRVEVD